MSASTTFVGSFFGHSIVDTINRVRLKTSSLSETVSTTHILGLGIRCIIFNNGIFVLSNPNSVDSGPRFITLGIIDLSVAMSGDFKSGASVGNGDRFGQELVSI